MTGRTVGRRQQEAEFEPPVNTPGSAPNRTTQLPHTIALAGTPTPTINDVLTVKSQGKPVFKLFKIYSSLNVFQAISGLARTTTGQPFTKGVHRCINLVSELGRNRKIST